MIIDLQALAPGRERRYDVCIVGAGAAGITIARALRAGGRSIGLLESGGLEFADDTQALYRGTTEAFGLSRAAYLHASRLRFFGGTTNHWAGMCRPLDALDLEARPWVPHSGWPIGLDDLEPYYERAAPVLQFRPFDEQRGVVTLGPDSLVPPGGALVGRTFRYSTPTRFGRVYRQELADAPGVDVLLHANVVRIDLNEAGTSVERLQLATLGGRRSSVTARLFVLAAGGIENPRLLLLSNGVHKSGLGNGSDCVGRYFTEHPERIGGLLMVTSRAVREDLRALRRARAMLCLSDTAQRTHEILNANIDIGATTRFGESPAGGSPLDIAKALEQIDALGQAGGPTEAPAQGTDYTRCFIRAESAPRPDSRVTLDDTATDALGLPRARLTFVLGMLESRTFVKSMEVIAQELGVRQAGRALLRFEEDAIAGPIGGPTWSGLRGGNHHMGTTRMSETPASGVVDRHCRVHGVPNLYVAGSSVFPTAGMANPTFTIVALALRIADHIAQELGRGAGPS